MATVAALLTWVILDMYLSKAKKPTFLGAINGMVHCRGNQGDFDHWAQLGNQGWGWDDVLPYFKRCESNGRGAGPYHGADGRTHHAQKCRAG